MALAASSLSASATGVSVLTTGWLLRSSGAQGTAPLAGPVSLPSAAATTSTAAGDTGSKFESADVVCWSCEAGSAKLGKAAVPCESGPGVGARERLPAVAGAAAAAAGGGGGFAAAMGSRCLPACTSTMCSGRGTWPSALSAAADSSTWPPCAAPSSARACSMSPVLA